MTLQYCTARVLIDNNIVIANMFNSLDLSKYNTTLSSILRRIRTIIIFRVAFLAWWGMKINSFKKQKNL